MKEGGGRRKEGRRRKEARSEEEGQGKESRREEEEGARRKRNNQIENCILFRAVTKKMHCQKSSKSPSTKSSKLSFPGKL
jgi:hypothetical protein